MATIGVLSAAHAVLTFFLAEAKAPKHGEGWNAVEASPKPVLRGVQALMPRHNCS